VLRRPRAAAGAVIGEATTIAWQLVRDRSTAGARGRWAGWRAGRGDRLPLDQRLLNTTITPWAAWRRRRAYGA
jgi:hypothetical protein